MMNSGTVCDEMNVFPGKSCVHGHAVAHCALAMRTLSFMVLLRRAKASRIASAMDGRRAAAERRAWSS